MTRPKTKKNENVEKTIIYNDDESKTIKDISDYINRCSHYSDLYSSEIVVFRGETEDFGETSCIPGIFRKDYLKNNPYFEKNILDEMSANGIAIGSTYLEKAINAQHDGFPSRLLDVSYNALIGLQFAVTPYYKYAEDSKDDKDGFVYIYHFEEAFCAVGDGISKNYDEIIKKEQNWYDGHFLFSRNFKFIDHMRINERIKAQNGAFILFQGDDPVQIPSCYYEKIVIPRGIKKKLRKDLKKLFDIDNSTIYPEVYNLVQKISDKGLRVKELPFTLENELSITLNNFEYILDKELSLLTNKESCTSANLRKIEKKLYLFKEAFDSFVKKSFTFDQMEIVNNFKSKYVNMLNEIYKFIMKNLPEDTEISDFTKYVL